MLDDIRTFITVTRTGSFAAAARELDLSPAMIGRRVAALEARYGIVLIERTTRTQRLSQAGEAFLPRAEALIEAADGLAESMHGEEAALSGRIRVSGPTTLGIKRLAPIVAEFHRRHSGVTIELSLNDRRVDLVGEGYDCALRIGELPASSLVARRISTYGFAACAAPELIARHGLPEAPEALSHYPTILNLIMRPRNRWLFERAGHRTEVEVTGSFEIDNGDAQLAAALAGAGAVYLPLDLVASDIAAGRLVKLLPGWKTLQLPVYLVRPTRNLIPARVRTFLDFVAERFAATA